MTEAFELELQQIFLAEATQLLADTEQCFLTIEKHQDDPTLLGRIFRLAHNLKGSANAVGFYSLGELTHAMESFLVRLKSGELAINRAVLDLLLQCNDQTTRMVETLKASPEAAFDIKALVQELTSFPPKGQAEAEAPSDGFTLFAVPDDPDRAAPLTRPQPSKALAAVKAPASGDDSIRVSLSRVETLLNFVGEQVILYTVLKEQIHSIEASPLLRKTVHQLGKVTKEVQSLTMSLRMVPLRTTLMKMQRIVRDTSGALNKQVDLVLSGEDTEVDKTILEMLGDPLVHLVRNAVDHGIEEATVRTAAGKPAQGTVSIRAFHQGDQLMIEVADDGAGLDAVKLKDKAIERGLIKAENELSDQAAHQLIFLPGFSTKSVVTDVSGRGVGMDVVKSNVEMIQGAVQIQSTPGQGSVFTIRVPLTLAIIDGLVIRSGSERFVVPLNHAYESRRPTLADLHHVSGVGEVFSLRGEDLPVYRLSELLGQRLVVLPSPIGMIAVIVRSAEQAFAILVDDIISQTQVVIKRLGAEHKALGGFSGSAILGDGRAVLILELPDLVAKQRASGPRPALRSKVG